MKLILGLVGQIASGKGSVSKYLREKYHASFYHFSAPLRKTLRIWHLEQNRQNIAALSKCLRDTFGQDLLAKAITQDIQNDQSEIIAVDSVRRLADIKYLKDLPEFKLLYIETSPEVRYKRLTERGENQDDCSKTYKEFLRDNELESEQEIIKIGKTAQLKINNDGTVKDLESQIDKIIGA